MTFLHGTANDTQPLRRPHLPDTDPSRLGDAALITRLRDTIAEAQRRPRLLPELRQVLAGTVDELTYEMMLPRRGAPDAAEVTEASERAAEAIVAARAADGIASLARNDMDATREGWAKMNGVASLRGK